MATLPGSSVVKRNGKLLESKRSVIPYGAGSLTSFRDQLKGLDGLGLRLLLYETPPEPDPKVLLSHSGTISTVPGSIIVKRVENHLESQLPVIPYGTGGQISCGDQLQSTDGLGLCLPLHETRLEPKHKIFLSHSGAQKSFVEQLGNDMERCDRYPFFNVLQTSLSIGCDFPNAIIKAIGQCQFAVVVLSEDFFSRTKGPMLELSALVKRKSHDPDLLIMPVFLGLTPEQCRERENLDRWFALWGKWAKDDQRIILEDWMVAFKVLGYINGVSLCGWDDVKCRQDIVDAVCREVPPETRWDLSHVIGRSRMCKTIVEKIGGMELSKRYKFRVLGLYGVGGIGKSTACKTLCNHYFEEFRGRVCHVEFGFLDELHMLQEILKRLTHTKHEQIEKFNLYQCQQILRHSKKRTTFLAIDNVFGSYESVEQAKFILRAGFGERSIVMVIASSLGQLQNLNIEESECMEMPELTVDDAISLFVQESICDKSTNEALIRHCVDRCQFSKGDGVSSHYHPLALRVLGGQLGSDSSQWLKNLERIDTFNQYEDDEHPIFSILRRGFDELNCDDQLLLMDCALSSIHCSYILSDKDGLYEWLSMIHGKRIKYQLNALKRKSLIEGLKDGTTRIGIHGLWREFCVMETKVGELESRHWIYEDLSGSSGSHIEESNVYCGLLTKARRISLIGTYARPCYMHLDFSRCSRLVALHLIHVHLEGNVLDLNGMYNLKSLIVQITSNWEVRGLASLEQLSLLEWHDEMPSNMAFN